MPITHDQIRAGRNLAGLTLQQLSDLTGIRVGRLNDIERGKRENPRPENLELIKQVLERHGVQFREDGWVRHIDDCTDFTDKFPSDDDERMEPDSSEDAEPLADSSE